MSGINFVSNPLVNTHLQERVDTYPKRRDITRVNELNEAGINVCSGHDDINEALKFISSNSARTFNIEDKYRIEIGKLGNLIILNAENGYDAVRRRAGVIYYIIEGQVIAKTIPSRSFINIDEEKEITFKK